MGETGEVRQQLGKRLGQRIAERRKSLVWTQDQLAERLGVTCLISSDHLFLENGFLVGG